MVKAWGRLFLEAGAGWLEDKGPRLGAALAYYALFSLAPLLLITVAAAGLFFGREAAQGHLFEQLHELLGADESATLQTLIAHAGKGHTGVVATVVGGGMLLFGAMGLFVELQDALNAIWRVAPPFHRGLWDLVTTYLPSFLMVLGSASLLLVSLMISAALTVLERWFGAWQASSVVGPLHILVSCGLIGVLSSLLYRVLPNAVIAWKDVWLGATVTALFFSVGKYLLGIYLVYSAAASAYGAAGSLVVLLIWLYYSAQVFLFGAELTKVYARRLGSHRQPTTPADKRMQSSENRSAPVAGQSRFFPPL